MELVKITGVGKNSGKEYTAYKFVLGDFESPLFFIRSKIELNYLLSKCDELGIEHDF